MSDIDFSDFNSFESKHYGFPLIFMVNLLQSLFFLFLFITALYIDRADYFYFVEKVGEQTKDDRITILSGIFFLAITLLIGKKFLKNIAEIVFAQLL